jgi:hypothetical protein
VRDRPRGRISCGYGERVLSAAKEPSGKEAEMYIGIGSVLGLILLILLLIWIF